MCPLGICDLLLPNGLRGPEYGPTLRVSTQPDFLLRRADRTPSATPLPTELLVPLVSLVGLLLASAFFSGSETALFSLREVDLDEMQRSRTARERRAASLARNPNRTLVALLVANMAVNVLISVLMTSIALSLLGPDGLAVAIPVATVVLVVFGEILPKTLGLRNGRRVATLAAPMVSLLAVLLYPVRRGLEALASVVSGSAPIPPLSRDELGTLVSVARDEGAVTGFEGRVLRRILRFATITVGRCLTPRVEMVGVPHDCERATALQTFETSGHSRIVVYEDSIDHVVGMLLLKDVLTRTSDHKAAEWNVADVMREPYFVPESMLASKLFKQFQLRFTHAAVVVGEHGGVEGLVTLEDLLEEIIGDIRDETDEPETELELMPDGSWRVDAGVDLQDLAESIGVELEPEGDAVTLSGMLEERLGRIPRAGDTWNSEQLDVQVLTAKPTRPLLVRISRHEVGQ